MTQRWYGCTMEFYRGLIIYTIVFKITQQETNLLMARQLHYCMQPILKAGIHDKSEKNEEISSFCESYNNNCV